MERREFKPTLNRGVVLEIIAIAIFGDLSQQAQPATICPSVEPWRLQAAEAIEQRESSAAADSQDLPDGEMLQPGRDG